MAKAGSKTKTKAKVEAQVETQAVSRSDEVRQQIRDAISSVERGYVDLSLLLNEAYKHEFYKAWGFNEFKDYADQELNCKYRKAMYLQEVGQKISDLNLPRERVEALGWTKFKELVSVMTADNALEWLEKAEGMTSREVVEAVKITRKKDTSGGNVPTVTTLSIKMTEAEGNTILSAIDEAKKLTGSDNATMALEMICQDWLQEKGAIPERTTLNDVIRYAERVYGVSLKVDETNTPAMPPEPAPTETPATETEAKETGSDDLNDLLGIS